MQSIKDRFEQPGYKVYEGLENLVLKAVNKVEFSEELVLVVDMYGTNLDESTFHMQLQILGANVPEKVLQSLMLSHSFNKLLLLKDPYSLK